MSSDFEAVGRGCEQVTELCRDEELWCGDDLDDGRRRFLRLQLIVSARESCDVNRPRRAELEPVSGFRVDERRPLLSPDLPSALTKVTVARGRLGTGG